MDIFFLSSVTFIFEGSLISQITLEGQIIFKKPFDFTLKSILLNVLFWVKGTLRDFNELYNVNFFSNSSFIFDEASVEAVKQKNEKIRMIQRELPRSPFTTYRNVLPQCACSFDKNKGLSAAGAQTLRTHSFFRTPRRVLAFGLANIVHSALAIAGERSGITNTVLSDAASSKRVESHFARENKYF